MDMDKVVIFGQVVVVYADGDRLSLTTAMNIGNIDHPKDNT
jgi:hypothetical protein